MIKWLSMNLNKSGKKFLYYNLLSTIIFGILYTINELVFKTDNRLHNSIFYWFRFSLISQTTVGYTNIIINNENREHWINNYNLLFKIINTLQLVSIFIITANFIN